MIDGTKIPVCKPPLPSSLSDLLGSCIESRWWGYGPRCAMLERQFTSSRGGWALATSSCTAALNVVAQLIHESDRDEVIIPAMTFVSTAMAFYAAGMRPIIVDVDPETLLLDEKAMAERLTPRTRAVVAVHLYGQRCELSALRAFCNDHKLALIEDCAHRIGNLGEEPVGDFACYSFNAVKEAPAGDGGLLWARDASLELTARELTYVGMSVDSFQRSSKTIHANYCFGANCGTKLRLTDVGATFVLSCLEELGEWREKRRLIFTKYEEELSRISPQAKLLPRRRDDSYLMFVVRVPRAERAQVRLILSKSGVSTSTHYPSLSRHPLWCDSAALCPVAETAEFELVTLPCFPDLESYAQDRVISAWRSAWT